MPGSCSSPCTTLNIDDEWQCLTGLCASASRDFPPGQVRPASIVVLMEYVSTGTQVMPFLSVIVSIAYSWLSTAAMEQRLLLCSPVWSNRIKSKVLSHVHSRAPVASMLALTLDHSVTLSLNSFIACAQCCSGLSIVSIIASASERCMMAATQQR
jgi:hypothetical protein